MGWNIFGESELTSKQSISVIHSLLAEFELHCLTHMLKTAVFCLLRLQQDCAISFKIPRLTCCCICDVGSCVHLLCALHDCCLSLRHHFGGCS